MDAHAIFNAFSTFQQSFHSWWNTAQTPFWWLSQTQVNNPTIINNYIIRWILHPFWLALMYDLSEDRRIDDVAINDILLFYHTKQTDSFFWYICSVKDHSCDKKTKNCGKIKMGGTRGAAEYVTDGSEVSCACPRIQYNDPTSAQTQTSRHWVQHVSFRASATCTMYC